MLNMYTVNVSQVHEAQRAVPGRLAPTVGNILSLGAKGGLAAWCWVYSTAAGLASQLAWR